MKKISVTLDVSKIDKTRIVDRTYKNKDGGDVTQRLYKFDVIELKEKKFVKDGDTWTMYKTHFAVEGQTPQEKKDKATNNYIGEGMTFESKDIRVFTPEEKATIDKVRNAEIEQQKKREIDPEEVYNNF